MDIYSFEDINAALGDCLRLATGELGLSPAKGKDHFNTPWRSGSDSGALHIFEKGWKDHVSGEKGTALDLVCKIKYNGDIWLAQSELGKELGLKAKHKAKEHRKVVKEYIYEDLQGQPVHKTIRYEPKEFAQAHWDATKKEWVYGLKDIEPILYRMRSWINLKWVCVVGGEKDVDNAIAAKIPATTNALGEGHWSESYNVCFKGKKVIIIPDNDEVGRLHAQIVAWNLKDIAAEIRVVELPGLDAKGDISDWLAAGGTKEKFIEIVSKTPKMTEFKEPKKDENIKQLSEAKRANNRPFRNYRTMEIETPTGKRTEREPIHINELVAEIFKRFWNFPRRVGSSIFDHDRKNGRIRFLETPAELFAWIQEKSGHPAQWARIEGAVSQEQLYDSIRANCEQYEMISGVPNWPQRADVYYTHGELPKPTEDAKYFNEFCKFFSPSTAADEVLIKVFFTSPLYYKAKVDRPLWVIDSTTGQGCFGKGTLIRKYDGSVAKVEGIKEGDILMGADSTPRNVLELRRGQEEMFEFEFINGEKHIYNRSHILYLHCTQTHGKQKNGDRITITVDEYLQWSKRKKGSHTILKAPILSYEEKELEIPPYILGIWLGDGHSGATALTNPDPEIKEIWEKYGVELGLNIKDYENGLTTFLCGERGQKNILRNKLRNIGVWENKHIPETYLKSSFRQRLDLLAGILDADGYCYKRSFEITQKNELLANNILELARSVGASANIKSIKKYCMYKGEKREDIYFQVHINRNTEIIPTKVKRKQINETIHKQRLYLNYGIKNVRSLGIGDYYGFILDGDHLFLGADYTVLHNSGKTKLSELAAYLYGGDDLEQGEPIWADQSQVSSEQMIETVKRRLLSRTGRKKRIFLIDNVTGFFQANALASMVTQGSLSGIAPYGKGEETRPNDLTYVITSNSASVSRDLSARAFFIWLSKPDKPLREWEKAIQEYIRKHRLQIIADIIGILQKGHSFNLEPSTRFRTWEREVMQPICGDEDVYNMVLKTNNERCSDSDGEAEEAENVREVIRNELIAIQRDPDNEPIFIENAVLRIWIQKAMPGFGGVTGKAIPHIIRNWAKTKAIPELCDHLTRMPGGKSGRGIGWNIPQIREQGYSTKIKKISLTKGQK